MDVDAWDQKLSETAGLGLDQVEQLVADLPDRTRMAAAAWVLHQLRDARRQRATYRSLIYDFLGFAPRTGDRNQPDAYRLFMAAGALQLNNALADAPEEELKRHPPSDA